MSDSSQKPYSQGQESPFASWKAPLADGGIFDTFGRASLLGLHIVSGILVGCVLGWLLDRWLDSFPWCSAVGLFVGILAGFNNMLRDARRIIRQSEKSEEGTAHDDKTPPSATQS